jgi:hypothetical protein
MRIQEWVGMCVCASLEVRPHTVPAARSPTRQSLSSSTSSSWRASRSRSKPSYRVTSARPLTISGGAGGWRGAYAALSSGTGGGGGGGGGKTGSSWTRPQLSAGPVIACELMR